MTERNTPGFTHCAHRQCRKGLPYLPEVGEFGHAVGLVRAAQEGHGDHEIVVFLALEVRLVKHL